MKPEKMTLIDGISEIYGLANTPDYARFLNQPSATEKMGDNWRKIGVRLINSSKKVINDGDQKKAA